MKPLLGVHWPTSPKVWFGLMIGTGVMLTQVYEGQYQSAMQTMAGIFALLGIGGQVSATLKTSEANKVDLTDIRDNPLMPGTPPETKF